jgi:uncharacterized protein HemX
MDSVPVRVRGDKPQSVPEAAPTNRKSQRSSKRLSPKQWLAAALVVVVLLAGAGAWWWTSQQHTGVIDTSKYQAVFFTNGQVYFGKLEKLDDNNMKLTHVFYLQTPNSSTNGSSQNPQDANKSSQLQLTKLGTEIHSPEDEMVISKSQVLFFENLKDDGKVVQGIGTYYKEQQNK